jgi:fibronectin type 3 domain-containing protein
LKPSNRIQHILATIVVVVVAVMFIGTAGFIAFTYSDLHQDENVALGIDPTPFRESVLQEDLTISYHRLAQSELEALKLFWGANDEGASYNIMVDGLGTGLAPPSERDWELMADDLLVVDSVQSIGSIPSSVDISDQPYFPQVANQGGQGSCAAWAMTYYSYGYLEARDNGWTDACTGNADHLMSPAWTYNRANSGVDMGSSMYRNAHLIMEWGVATLSTMPYTSTDYISWGDEDAMREAPLHRALDYFTMSYMGDTTVEEVKSLVASSTPVTFAIDANAYAGGFADGNYRISSAEYSSNTINHAQTIVGYDDSITDDGEVGAFRVVNSWGSGWGDAGYYWLTYNAFKEIGGMLSLGYLMDRSDYEPQLLATWKFSQSPTRDADITFSVSSSGVEKDSKDLYYSKNSDGKTHTFPSFMCLDITEFNPEFQNGASGFSMAIGSATYNGKVSSFRIEGYDLYSPGQPSAISGLPSSLPINTPCELTTNFDASQPTVPGVPQNLQATSGDGMVGLSWQAPLSDGGSSITQYRIYRGTSSSSLSLLTSTTSLSYTDNSVTNGNTYYYAVSAVNSAGEGAKSNQATANPESQSEATTPSTPLNIKGTAGDSTVMLEWSPPADDGGSPITSYKIYRRTPEVSYYYVYRIGVQSSYTFTGLTNGQTYLFSICAGNDVGYGPKSAEIQVVPGGSASPPDAPASLSATAGNSLVELSWELPLDDGGSSITSYNIYRGLASSSLSLLSSTSSLQYTDTSVTNGMTYYYAVSAVNGAGEGPLSPTASAKPQAAVTVPGAPTGLSAEADSSAVELSWQSPASDGGSPITAYRVYRGTTPQSLPLLTTVTTLSHTDQSVSNGVTYFYAVSAVNSAGEGERSSIVSATPGASDKATVPSVPLDLAGTPGDSTVVLSWSPPADDGGSPVTGYRIYRRTPEVSYYYVYSIGVQASYTFTGLTNGQTYLFSVCAQNDIGYGPRTGELAVTPGGGASVPSSPLNLKAVAGVGEVELDWDAPINDGGASITSYRLYRGTNPSYQSLLVQISSTGYTDSSAVNGLTYYYRVTAVNQVGEGPSTSVVQATPTNDISVPSAPMGLSASAGDRSVALSWYAPQDDGGSAITGYRVYRGMSSASMSLLTQVTGLSYTDISVTNGVTYTYQVAALNAVGQSEPSSSVTATPGSSSETTVPGTPLNVKAVGGDGAVTVYWDPPASDGGSLITGYKIYRRTPGVSYYYVYKVGDINEFTFRNLENGQTYLFSVSACNEVGYGQRSNEVAATPMAAFSSMDSQETVTHPPMIMGMGQFDDLPRDSVQIGSLTTDIRWESSLWRTE